MKTRGTHLLSELEGCDADLLDDVEYIEAAARRAATAAGARVVTAIFHPFSPQGVTGVLVLEESHLSIHTWPEVGYCAVDLYTCGDCDPERAHASLVDALRATSSERMQVERGVRSEGRSMRVLHHTSAERRKRAS